MTCAKHTGGCACIDTIIRRLAPAPPTGGITQAQIQGAISGFSDPFDPSADADTHYFFSSQPIHTLDPVVPNAAAVAVKGGKILSLLTDQEWTATRKTLAATEMTELKGTVVPGFYESHLHPLLDGLMQSKGIDVRDVNSAKGLVLKLQAPGVARTIGAKSLYFGYNLDPLSQVPGEQSTSSFLKVLDDVSKSADAYVLVEHNSMHIWYVNSNLFSAIEKTKAYQNSTSKNLSFPKSPDGQPSGIVQEDEGIAALTEAMGTLFPGLFGATDVVDAIHAIGKQAQSVGCTTITEAMLGSMPGDLLAYTTVIGQSTVEDFPVSIVLHPFNLSPQTAMLKNVLGGSLDRAVLGQRLRFGAVKFVIDGSLQGGTAANPPYRADTYGKYFPGSPMGVYNQGPWQENNLQAALQEYIGYQPMLHANSTPAIELVIETLSSIYSDAELRQLGARIEHCQVPTNDQLEQMQRKGIFANFLVNHVYYWGNIYETELLPVHVARRISPVKSAIDRQLKPALHSDAYVSPLSPLRLIWTAVNRIARVVAEKPSTRVFVPEEKISPLEALKAVTLYAAALDKADDLKGSLSPGKWADMTVLDCDILQPGNEQKILGTKVLGTVLAGRWIANSLPDAPGQVA